MAWIPDSKKTSIFVSENQFTLLFMTDKKKIHFIVNPISGTQKKGQIIKSIPRYLDTSRFDYEIKSTQYAGHAAKLALEATENGIDIVVAIGGDGTVNEVARSLVHQRTALGIIPCGSGNGLARHLEIPIDPIGALQVLNECVIHELDYGKINNIPFFCTCGIGFDAFVSSKFAEAGKRGFLTYIENTLREGLLYKPDNYTITVDDNEQMVYQAFLIACANASQYGNNAYIAPNASMSDGLMDVTIMEPITVLEAPQIAIQLFNRTIDHNSKIKTFRCKKVSIEREAPGVIHFDGDPVMSDKNITVELVEKGLNVVVNSHISPQPPLLRMFSNFYSDVYNELTQFRGELLEKQKRILHSHQEHIRNSLKRLK